MRIPVETDYTDKNWVVSRVTTRQKGVPLAWLDWNKEARRHEWSFVAEPVVRGMLRYTRLEEVMFTVFGPKEKVEKLMTLNAQQDKYDVESEELANGMMFMKVVLK